LKYLSEFRDPVLAKKLIRSIKDISRQKTNLMEVCGTHTVAISKSGIRQVLPENITLLSGPGCPVCVTANSDLDKAISIAQTGVIFTTFGDMLKVPSSYSSLGEEKAKGVDVRVVYSTLDALKIAEEHPDREVVFYAVGFETTAPTIAISLLEAERRGIKNYSVYCVHKIVPPAMRALLDLGELGLEGFLCPGHVSTIIGSAPYEFITDEYQIPCVVAGFEPLDILQSVLMLVQQVEKGEAKVEIQYTRSVLPEGNKIAMEMMERVFEVADAEWRGIGIIPGSGLKVKEEYAHLDAERRFEVEVPPTKPDPPGCSCGEILRGIKFPYDCQLFGKACTPERPIGPCMVSSEGSCAAYYRYREA
jgi:hydrogenase expression/formation protein HypD